MQQASPYLYWISSFAFTNDEDGLCVVQVYRDGGEWRARNFTSIRSIDPDAIERLERLRTVRPAFELTMCYHNIANEWLHDLHARVFRWVGSGAS